MSDNSQNFQDIKRKILPRLFVIIVFIGFITISVFSIYFILNRQDQAVLSTSSIQTPDLISNPNWKTYHNDLYDFTLRYPEEISAQENLKLSQEVLFSLTLSNQSESLDILIKEGSWASFITSQEVSNYETTNVNSIPAFTKIESNPSQNIFIIKSNSTSFLLQAIISPNQTPSNTLMHQILSTLTVSTSANSD